MAKAPIRIKRAVRAGNYIVDKHCTDALADETFNEADAIAAVLSAQECSKYTDDESHARWKLCGYARDGRPLNIVVTIHQGTVIFKTVYEG